MGFGEDKATAVPIKAGANLRAEVGEQLQLLTETGRKISEMADAVNLRLFGPHPQPERTPETPPLSPEAPIESIFITGFRGIRSAQAETAKTLQEILNRL